jgi:hypothetical protein
MGGTRHGEKNAANGRQIEIPMSLHWKGFPIRRILRRVRTDAYTLNVLANPAVSYWAWPMISLVSCVLLFLLVRLVS